MLKFDAVDRSLQADKSNRRILLGRNVKVFHSCAMPQRKLFPVFILREIWDVCVCVKKNLSTRQNFGVIKNFLSFESFAETFAAAADRKTDNKQQQMNK